tara:strand:+ start:4427 stop:4699 length:273 start_codon:yes stop_codon:yes gene_type:complete
MDLIAHKQAVSEPLNESDLSDESIFHLSSLWNTEKGESIQLEELKGKTLVMVMIYTTCKAACPRLVADMRNKQEVMMHCCLNTRQMPLIN